ncbi:MAG: cell division protein FtsW [Lachnospiraceae bacterium]|jgi:cell division protein FtsW|nr:cell division protein FtsW [Lachnospiraceae bacterium]
MSEQNRPKKKKKYFFDYTMLFIVLFLVLFGLVMLYSTSSYEANIKFEDPAFYFRKQAVASAIGIGVMLVVMLVDYHHVQRFAFIAYVVSLILIILVLTPLGYEAGGARRWLNLGMSLQPAEVAKLALIVFFASVVCKFGDAIKEKRGFLTVLALALPHAFCVLTITQNLSSAIIIFSIVFMMLFVATPQYKEYFIIAGVALVFAVGMVLLIKYDVIPASLSYRFARIKAWLDPEAYASNKGFQTLQALYAIGSGDIFGKGLGESIQKLGYLPEAQNDMIFSIICEELGLFGAIAIILLFVLLIWRFMVIANNAQDMFGALIVVGVMAHISIQVILNIAVVTNTIPNTGITLPFISYGGSSIVFLLAEMGLVLSVSRSIRVEE